MQQESPLTEGTSSQGFRQTTPTARTSKITRKSHKKSRAGCKNCKARRIKCDERQPQCANCRRREVRCNYAGPPTSSTPQSQSVNQSRSDDLALSDVELTFHWTTSICHSLSAWRSGATQWQNLLTDISLQHPHVLHLMFALTALHLASCRPNRRDEYIATADRHYERALVLVTPEIANIGPTNCDAVYTSVQLICFVGWARGPQPGEYLAFGSHGRSDWLVMFRGVRTTREGAEKVSFDKTLAPALRRQNRPLPSPDQPFEYEDQLRELRDHVAAVSVPAERDDNIHAVDVLLGCFENRYGGIDSEYHVVFAWLYRMSDEFLEQLQRRKSIPLIIYAHFIILMHDMERFWYMRGWTHHIMSGIFEALPVEDRPWIQWPMASVGWIAP